MSAISPSPFSGAHLSSQSDPGTWSLSGLDGDLGTVGLEAPTSWTPVEFLNVLAQVFIRRWQRERRRRKVGRAYDMALEIARSIPRGSSVLDVGCGNGYIAHHLTALLSNNVLGIDVTKSTEAPISYQEFDGSTFPVGDSSLDAALFCYVLHHAQDLKTIFREARRALRNGGLLVIYEDIPETAWDRIICAIHNRKWRNRTGPCTFRSEREWQDTFASEGFELCKMRRLSRWRNLAHPVSRRFFLLRVGESSRQNLRSQSVRTTRRA